MSDERQPDQPPEDGGDGSDSLKSYLEYNRVLRTWFVAFGVGGPALFLVNEDVARRLAAEGELNLVASLFLAGAALQVIGAFINKVANWFVYESTHDAERADNWVTRLSASLIDMFWIDVVIDVTTIAAFGWAAWLMLTVFANAG